MGRSVDILEIGPNDDQYEVIRKCNYNFRNYLSAQNGGDASVSEVRDDIDNVKKNLAEQVQKLTDLINDTAQKQSDKINDLSSKIDDLANKLENIDIAPPVGTYIYALYNPNEQWAGTTWEQVAEGNFLIAAGDTYLIGEPYGENQHTLTAAEMPSHYHYTYRNFVVDVGWHDANNNWARPRPGGGNTPWNVTSSPATSSTGGSQPHNNIPQSIAVPLWKRTA